MPSSLIGRGHVKVNCVDPPLVFASLVCMCVSGVCACVCECVCGGGGGGVCVGVCVWGMCVSVCGGGGGVCATISRCPRKGLQP